LPNPKPNAPYTYLGYGDIDDIYESLQLPEGERSPGIKRELTVSLYVRGVLSFGKASALAELSKREFQEPLGERKSPRHYGKRELDEDLDDAR
jgi:predicted HTH domain antitoxin